MITAQHLHSTGITPLRSSYAPLRLPLPQTERVMVFPSPIRTTNLWLSVVEGLSQILQLFFRCALSPVTPSDLTCACVYFFHVNDRLHHLWKVGRRNISVTRPKQVHFIRAHIFVVSGNQPCLALAYWPTPQCFACFVTSTRQSATN
jgi:hypothetical protein